MKNQTINALLNQAETYLENMFKRMVK